MRGEQARAAGRPRGEKCFLCATEFLFTQVRDISLLCASFRFPLSLSLLLFILVFSSFISQQQYYFYKRGVSLSSSLLRANFDHLVVGPPVLILFQNFFKCSTLCQLCRAHQYLFL